MNKKVVVTDYGFPDLSQETALLNKAGYEVVGGQCRTEEDVIALAKDAVAIIAQWAPVSEKVISQLSDCKIIVRYGIGVDNVDLEAAKRKNIPVCNVPDYCINEVADHAVALALALGRQLKETGLRMNSGTWKITPPARMPAFREMTFATVGFGRIAREVMKRVASFGFRLISHDPYINAEQAASNGVESVGFDQLLRDADIISLHLPLTSDTYHIINENSIGMMKPGAIIINTSRGGLIDLTALTTALEEKRIGGAGLDVFEQEPLPVDHPVHERSNAILTSHTAWYSESSIPILQRKAAEEVVRGLEGKALKNRVA